MACGILVPWPGIEPVPPAVEAGDRQGIPLSLHFKFVTIASNFPFCNFVTVSLDTLNVISTLNSV